MIVTRTPYRISLMGGGSDYPRYFNKFGGAVLATTIDKYCHVSLSKLTPFLGFKYGILWSKGFQTAQTLEEIEHPSVKGCLEYLRIVDGIEVRHGGDLPARSGLGSSSAFTVGMLHALHLMVGHKPSRAQLAKEAIAVEQDVLKETVGIQDQIECAWGGSNIIAFNTEGHYTVGPLRWLAGAEAEIESHLMLMWTGLQRFASEIAQTQVDNVDRKQKEITELVALVPDAAKAMEHGDAKLLGAMLHESWLLKRELSDKIATPEIDEMYEAARQAGAYGGKVIGAGGGGFMVLCAPPELHSKIAEATEPLTVPVKFEHRGSEAVLVAP